MTLIVRTYLPWLMLLLQTGELEYAGLYTTLRVPPTPFEFHKLYTLLTAH